MGHNYAHNVHTNTQVCSVRVHSRVGQVLGLLAVLFERDAEAPGPQLDVHLVHIKAVGIMGQRRCQYHEKTANTTRCPGCKQLLDAAAHFTTWPATHLSWRPLVA